METAFGRTSCKPSPPLSICAWSSVFRVSERHNWFYDIAQDKSYAVYTHEGFAWHEQEAREYNRFLRFGIEQPLWPVYGKELQILSF